MKLVNKVMCIILGLILLNTGLVYAQDIVVDEGEVIVDCEFENASIVKIEGNDFSTQAVVDEGKIKFNASKSGEYKLTDTGETVLDYWVETLRTTDMSVGTYKGDGSLENPYTIMSTFADCPMEKFKLQAAWKGYNVLAGYPEMESTNDADYINNFDEEKVDVLLVEDRDEETGKLKGSFLINGHLWDYVTGNEKGPYYMNYLLDPTDEFITSGYALENHYLYSNDNVLNVKERFEEASKKIKDICKSDKSSLFFSYRMRDYSGPIEFSVYLGDSGKFNQGDVVSIHYLLGAGDRNLYHGVKPSWQELVLKESTFRKYYQDKGMKGTVDENGFLTFKLYNGGYFELRNETSIAENRKVEVLEKEYKLFDLNDVEENNWAYECIYSQLEKGCMTTEDGNFNPYDVVTRGDFIKALLLSSDKTIISGRKTFDDVSNSNPYSDFVYTAVEENITKGISETEFGVYKELTRETAAVFICRAMDLEPTVDNFTDSESISSWAKGYVGACAKAGYIKGFEDGSFGPQKQLTRAESATLTDRLLGK